MAGSRSGGFPPRSSGSGATRDMLRTRLTVTLSLSDWMALCGWASAHVTDYTPALIENILREIGQQVVDS